jgi:competence protein ComEC
MVALCALVTIVSGWTAFHLASPQIPRLAILTDSGGAAVYAETESRQPAWLIDSATSNAVPHLVTPYLHARGIDTLPTLTLSHGDIQHVGGAPQLIDSFAVSHLVLGYPRFRSPTYRQTVSRFPTNRVSFVRPGQSFGPWTVLHPDPGDPFSLADENALVARADLNGTHVVYLSDLAPQGQDRLLSRGPLPAADVVITGLPSRGEPLRAGLLEMLRPKIIIVIDAEYPAPRRASESLQARLATSGATVLYTRDRGSIELRFHRGEVEIRPAQGPAFRAPIPPTRARQPLPAPPAPNEWPPQDSV